MDSGWVAAIASLVSALIVAVTAVAAFRQLRHYRNANDIVVYLRLIDMMDSTETVAARASLAMVARRFESDAEFRLQLTDPSYSPEELRAVASLLRFLEHISVLISKGGVAEALVVAEYAEIFIGIWEQMRPLITQRRVAFGPHTGRAFEHLAMRSRRYIDSGDMEREYSVLESDATPLRTPTESMPQSAIYKYYPRHNAP